MTTPRYGVSQERDWNELPDEEFRAIVRAEIEAHYPSDLRYVAHRLLSADLASWVAHLARKGWLAPGWPVEFGGMGLAPIKQIIYLEEFERWGVARHIDHGVTQVGPVIIRYGTREQHDRWLPPILAAEHRWVQGYSEPDAGSDLASLRTRATRDADEYVLEGQKTWTTLAHDATHIYVLARTNPDVKKQAGISFFLVDLSSPGITVRPIRDIAGHHELCEVFLNDVVVPAENLIGAENEGWTIAKSLLGHERINLGSPKLPEYGLSVLRRVAAASGALDDPGFRERVSAAQLDVEDLANVYAGYVDRIKAGKPLGPDVSMLKIWATETFARIADLILEAAGDTAALAGHVELGNEVMDVVGAFYKARPSTIYGGSNEIQRNIIARDVLDLPSG